MASSPRGFAFGSLFALLALVLGGFAQADASGQASGWNALGLLRLPALAGTPYHVASAQVAPTPTPVELVVDNADAVGVTITGAWNANSATGTWGTNYLQDGNTGKGVKSVRFTPQIPVSGTYQVFARWIAGTNRATNVPLDVNHAGGISTVVVNQQQNNATWVSLGTFSFAVGRDDAGGSLLVRTNWTNGYVFADAVKFTLVSASPTPTPQSTPAPTATPTPRPAELEVIVDDTETPGLDNQGQGLILQGEWITSTTSTGYHNTRYLHDNNAGKGTKSATFVPYLPRSGKWAVYVTWTSQANRAPNVPVVINHANGSTTVAVNQQRDGHQWMPVGSYDFGTGASSAAGSVSIQNAGTQSYYVMADAVRFVSISPDNRAPVANDDAYTTPSGTALSAGYPGVLSNDSDPDLQGLTASVVGQPLHGNLTVQPNGSFTYTPQSGYTGQDRFTYRASDGGALSAPATVWLGVGEPAVVPTPTEAPTATPTPEPTATPTPEPTATPQPTPTPASADIILDTPQALIWGNSGEVQLSWSQSSMALFSEYRLYRATHPGVTEVDTLISVQNEIDWTGYGDALPVPPAPGVRLYYRVWVYDVNGEGHASNEESVLLVDEAPAPITLNPPTRDKARDRVNLSWALPQDYDLEEYRLYRAEHPNVTASDTLIRSSNTQDANSGAWWEGRYTDTAASAPTPGRTYYYRFLSRDFGGQEVWGNEVSITMQAIERPDLLARVQGEVTSTGDEVPFVGDGVYSSSGTGQEQSVLSIASYKRSFEVKVQNDTNTAQEFIVTGLGDAPGYTVRYLKATDGTDITAQVTGVGWNTGMLALDGEVVLRVEATPTGAGALTYEMLVSARPASASASDGDKSDAVKLTLARQGLAGVQISRDFGKTWTAVAQGETIEVERWEVVGVRAVKANSTATWPHSGVGLPFGPKWKQGLKTHVGQDVYLQFANLTGDSLTGEPVQAECGNTINFWVRVTP